MSTNSKYRNKLYIIFFIGILILFSFRLLHLDADIPNWGITHYMPIDEGSYSLMALNKYDYGTVDPSYLFDGSAPYVAPQLRNNLIGNIFTYVSLQVFGDNYYGLRIPSAVYFLIIFCGTVWIFKYIYKKYTVVQDIKANKFNGLILFLLALLMIFDFDLLVSSRVCENSLLRSVFVVLSVIVCCVFDQKSVIKKYFLLTFLATISVFLVYITNAFLGLAVAMTVVIECLVFKKNEFVKAIAGCISGGISALVLSEIYYICVWHTFPIRNMFQTIKAFQDANAYNYYESATTIYSFFDRTIAFVTSDITLYNLPIFFLTAVLGIWIIVRTVRMKEIVLTFVECILMAFYIQTLFAEDVIIKKFLIVYPCVLVLLYFGILSAWDVKKVIKKVDKGKVILIKCFCAIYGMICF